MQGRRVGADLLIRNSRIALALGEPPMLASEVAQLIAQAQQASEEGASACGGGGSRAMRSERRARPPGGGTARAIPPFAERFRDLMTRIERNDNEIAILSRALPRGCSALLSAELVARDLAGYRSNGAQIPQLSTVVLPGWSTPHYAWPKCWRAR